MEIQQYRAKKKFSDSSDSFIIGAYVYDDVHKKHFMIYSCMHGLTESEIDISTLEESIKIEVAK